MNEKTKAILWKVFWIVISFLLLEVLVVAVTYLVSLLNTYNIVDLFTTDQLLQSYKELFTHLPQVVKSYIDDRNKLFIIGSIIALIYVLYLHNGKLKSDGWETENKNTYHGSARWAKPSEIFDKQNFFNQTKKSVLSDFEKSLIHQPERTE